MTSVAHTHANSPQPSPPPKSATVRFIPAALVGGLAVWEALLIVPLDYGMLTALHQKGIGPLLAVIGVAVVLALLVFTLLAGLILRVRMQFSLRVFLGFAILCCLASTWFARAFAQADREHKAKEAAVAQGFSLKNDQSSHLAFVELVPTWVRGRLEPEFFQKVERLRVVGARWRVDSGDSFRHLTPVHPTPPDDSTPVYLDWVGDFRDLKEMTLTAWPIVGLSLPDGAFGSLAKAPKITKLSFVYCGFSLNPLDLSALKNLEEVTFNNCSVDGELRLQFNCVKKLKRLEIVGSFGQNLAQTIDLSMLSDVENLSLSGVRLTPEIAAKLADWPSLRALKIENCNGAVGKIHLTPLANLEELALTDNQSVIPCIVELGVAKRLRKLTLTLRTDPRCRFRNDAPSRFPSLEDLTVRAQAFTDDDLAGMAELKQLRRLRMIGGQYVSREFHLTKASLDSLASLPKLEELTIDAAVETLDDIPTREEFQAALPNCRIVYDVSAMLERSIPANPPEKNESNDGQKK